MSTTVRIITCQHFSCKYEKHVLRSISDSHDAVRTSDNNCSVSDTSSHKTSGKSCKPMKELYILSPPPSLSPFSHTRCGEKSSTWRKRVLHLTEVRQSRRGKYPRHPSLSLCATNHLLFQHRTKVLLPTYSAQTYDSFISLQLTNNLILFLLLFFSKGVRCLMPARGRSELPLCQPEVTQNIMNSKCTT